ncbi:MAG: hypothetical protein LBM97_01980 [Candidatus Nomurabacteria bacterium]|nr:hypothetical protein [Candidatus Nomurabacteria bacterium]
MSIFNNDSNTDKNAAYRREQSFFGSPRDAKTQNESSMRQAQHANDSYVGRLTDEQKKNLEVTHGTW